jgi:hypothetical protein
MASSSLRGTRARALMAIECMVADASCARTPGSAEAGSSPFSRAARKRRHHREATARTCFAREIYIECHCKDLLQPFADRCLFPEDVAHRGSGIIAVAMITLDVELALVAERPVETWTVHAGGGTEVIQRGRGEAALAEQIERPAKRDVGLIGARPSPPFGLRRGRMRLPAFLYHLVKNSLTQFILCETV